MQGVELTWKGSPQAFGIAGTPADAKPTPFPLDGFQKVLACTEKAPSLRIQKKKLQQKLIDNVSYRIGKMSDIHITAGPVTIEFR